MKFIPPQTAEQKLLEQVSQLKQQLKKKQFPAKYAPKLDEKEIVVISGCAFYIHIQDKNRLVLAPKEDVNFNNGVNSIRVMSYLVGVHDLVSVAGWDWRPVRYKKNRLELKPYAPTLI